MRWDMIEARCLLSTATFAEPGVMLTAICWAIVTVAELDFVESATDVAVTNTKDGLGGAEGAV